MVTSGETLVKNRKPLDKTSKNRIGEGNQSGCGT